MQHQAFRLYASIDMSVYCPINSLLDVLPESRKAMMTHDDDIVIRRRGVISRGEFAGKLMTQMLGVDQHIV